MCVRADESVTLKRPLHFSDSISSTSWKSIVIAMPNFQGKGKMIRKLLKDAELPHDSSSDV